MKGLIFNIQRYSIHDGEGIRTLIFFKGCPLHCPWCSNPESQSFDIETVKVEAKCIHCKHCTYNADTCPTGAIKNFGKYMTIDEIIKEVMKDSVFYYTSGGGVTLSGGEVLGQAKFATELLKELKKLGVDTAIETSGQGSTSSLLEMSKYLDTILFDLKIMNEEKAKAVLGADINLIKNNLRELIKNNNKVIPRIPLIPNYTMHTENIKQIISFLKELNFKEVHLLPFHQYGSNKYNLLNKEYELKDVKTSSKEEINKIKELFIEENLNVVVGGL